jgi:hypothetical protein
MAIPISGSRGGFWLYVGWNKDDEMISDYVPCNAEGWPICISKGKNGYWNFHLPGKRTTVSFHRQLWRDLHGGARLSSRLEVNHLDRNRNHNCSFNLDGRVLTSHIYIAKETHIHYISKSLFSELVNTLTLELRSSKKHRQFTGAFRRRQR